MSFRANVIKVFIASPSDVLEERKLIRDAIHEWNDMHAAERSLVLLPVGWETHSAPSMAGKAQKVINSELLEDCDVLIAVFWTRLGTPTENDPSGTAEEIREHIGRDRHAMLYFSDAKASPSEVNAEQYKAVTAFRQEQMEKGLVESYESIDDFRRLLPRQIERLVKREIARLEAGMPSEFRGYVPDPLTRIKLSEEAERILYCAANADGSVLQLQTGGGNYVQFGNSIEPQNSTPRNQALWGAAVEELEGAGYIRDVGHDGQSFEVTKVGYEIADSLTAPAEKPHPLLNLAGTVASALCDLVELGRGIL